MAGLYIHIPYCRRKCIYCDFFSAGERIADWDGLADAIVREFTLRIDETDGVFRTLYVGGGTPSLFPAGTLANLLTRLREVAAERWQPIESTIELNPDDVTPEATDRWLQMGFDRFSIGVQSFDDYELQSIGRRHDSATAMRALDTLRSTGAALSIDLMYGLPRQTLDSWHRTLQTALSYRPEHLSAYALMYEEGTPLTLLARQKRITPADDDTYLAMDAMLRHETHGAGYEHYEISNYALPGHRAVHNSGYWHGTPYIGLGPAAHSYDGLRTRRANAPDIAAYICGDHHTDTEILNDEMLAEEYLLTRMRCREGIDIARFARRFGRAAGSALASEVEIQIAAGTMHITTDGRHALTAAGLLTSDDVILRLASAIS